MTDIYSLELQIVRIQLEKFMKPEYIEAQLDAPVPLWDGKTARQMVQENRTEEVIRLYASVIDETYI